ncbi:MAG: tetratricopeptide repeat protein [Parvibaculum sp.]|uniref:tetratricopeptide repeat protein n=1 Tax=Parvibaculum sp. TaxID=2024848 RepID=UPI002848E0E5|nr:tetratricopeptide repeat protein [Parvibaculum sp.]MDR3499373.1 tetratricopeptide repeat protein [Parvibaculum sp.]
MTMTEQGKQPGVGEMMALAWEHFRARRLRLAEELGRQVIAAQPDNHNAACLLGIVCFRNRQAKEAIAWMERAVEGNPDIAGYHSNLCEMYRQVGEVDRAVAAGRRAVELDPAYPQGLNNLGTALYEKQDFNGAEEYYRRAIGCDPKFAEVHDNLANALRSQRRYDEAIAEHRQAIALRPGYAEALNNLGNTLREAGRPDEAEQALHMAIGARPNYVEAYNNLALILWDRKQHDEALVVIAKAMAIQPVRASSLMIAGRFYNEREEFGRAVECYRKALSLRPRSLEILNTLSAIFLDIGDLAGADEMLQRMVALNPGHAATRVRRSMLRMLRGDMDGGLAEYDWRLAMPNVRPKDLPPLRPVNLPGRLWNGEPIEGKRLFIWSEQGLGDAIHCMRYLPNLAARGPAVLSGYFPPKLHQLSALNFPFFRIVPTGAEPPDADFHCEMMTLLRLVGRSPEWVETGKPYFKAPPGLVQEFRQRFSAYPGLKVGLVWAGNGNHKDDRNRSMPASALKPLAGIAGCHFFSLQVGDKAADADLINSGVIDISKDVSNITSTAAAIAALDLVIAVDTSLAHLAGAIGTPVWTLLSHVPDWRWGLTGDTTPLYRSMRLVRQPRRRSWPAVIAAVSDALRRVVEQRIGQQSGKIS